MPQATDIVLDSAGYMIAPGSPQSPGYKRLQDGYPEGLTQRTTITDFFGGQHRALQLERDKFHDSLCIGPALGGQGVTPWAVHTSFASAPITTHPNREQRIPHVVIKDRLYFAIGTRLYANPYLNYGNPGTFGPALIKDYPNPITDLTIIGSSNLLIAFGNAADILFRLDSGTEVAFAANERAHLIEAYAGYAVWVDARTGAPPSVLRLSKGVGTGVDMRHVSYDVIGMATVGGELVLVTKNALFTFSGSVVHTMVNNPAYNPASPGTTPPQIPSQSWSGEFKPFYQQGVYTERDDFRFITGYGGRTLAWIAGGVHEQVPSGDRAGWRSTGLDGRRCFGGTVAAGYAIVSIESHSGNNELWAYDGNGWWCIARQPMPAGNGTWCNPIGIGTAGGGTGGAPWNLMYFSDGTNQLHFMRLNPTYDHTISTLFTAYAPIATFVTPMIDAADRDKIKAWRKIGAVFASPELQGNPTSSDQVWVALDYSIDAGQTWTQATNTNHTGNTLASMNFDLEAQLAGVTSRFIMLRVRWEGVLDWAPILTGIWVEHEALASPARRRKWQLRIHARDQEVDRDGAMLLRTGRQLIEELWQAWETDTPLTFRDIDYDTDPTQRTVRIVGISEAATQPYDHGQWGDSHITLNLVEI